MREQVTEPVIWASVIRSMLVPLSERNLNTETLLSSCNISHRDLEHPHTGIPVSKYLSFMELAAEEADDSLLGIKMANSSGAEILGALGFLFLSSQTLLEALNNLYRYQALLQDAMHISLRREGNEMWYSYELLGIDSSTCRQDTEFSIAFTCRLIKMFCGNQIDISRIQFQHRPSATIQQYRQLLGTRVSFEEEYNAVRIPIDMIRHTGRLYDPSLFQILKDYLDADLEKKQHQVSFKEQITQIIYNGNVRAPVTAEMMANHLGISTATLNRRLRSEGVAFKQVVDNIHFDAAKRLLADTSLGITQIAQAIGFAGNASFTRAFLRWSKGVSPSLYRKGAYRS